MASCTFRPNGRSVSVESWVGLHGPKFGCGLGQCGAVGRDITTIEGLGTPDQPSPVQAAFMVDHHEAAFFSSLLVSAFMAQSAIDHIDSRRTA